MDVGSSELRSKVNKARLITACSMGKTLKQLELEFDTSRERFSGVLPESSPEECIERIQGRISHKRVQGRKLSSVEAHLGRTIPSLKRGLFAPSFLFVAGDILKLCLKPLPFFALLAIILVSERSTLAYFTVGEESEPEGVFAELAKLEQFSAPTDSGTEENSVPFAELASMDENTSTQEVPANTVDAAEAEQDLKAEAQIQATLPVAHDPHRGQVEFISGVIAVYLPNVPDAGLIAKEIVQMSKEEGVDPLFIASVISVESRFKSHAKSHVGATGLMQLIPRTAKDVARRLQGQKTYPRLTDPKTNIRLGITYLKELEQRYKGDRRLALAAYNWGPTNLDKARKGSQRIPGSVKHYVRTILEKTNRWKKHFSNATKGAEALANTSIISPRNDKNA